MCKWCLKAVTKYCECLLHDHKLVVVNVETIELTSLIDLYTVPA